MNGDALVKEILGDVRAHQGSAHAGGDHFVGGAVLAFHGELAFDTGLFEAPVHLLAGTVAVAEGDEVLAVKILRSDDFLRRQSMAWRQDADGAEPGDKQRFQGTGIARLDYHAQVAELGLHPPDHGGRGVHVQGDGEFVTGRDDVLDDVRDEREAGRGHRSDKQSAGTEVADVLR